MRIAGNEIVDALEERLRHHDRCRYAYIRWNVPVTEGGREALVEKHIRPAISFEADGKEIFWQQTLRFEDAEDSRDGKEHVIYQSIIMVNDVKKNILAIKAAIKHVARNVPDAMRKTARLVADGIL